MPTAHAAPLQFWIYCELKGNEQRMISSYYKEWLSLEKKINNQDEEKKRKNIDGEVER